jgi:pyruvate formate lyase activating enzyme
MMMKEASYWKTTEGGKVQCLLCPHRCVIAPDHEGRCRNKKNQDGKLYAHRYGEASALARDPIEKKPLYHFFPGRTILSVGTTGCNLACDFCQNHHLVNGQAAAEEISPAQLVKAAQQQRSFGIAYTYNEPFISYEYVLDAARLAREAGLKNVLVTNGFYNPLPFAELLPFIDAMNIDLKSIRDNFYKKLCKAAVDPVKTTIAHASKHALVEVTNLIVTDENDSDADLQGLVDWIASLSPDIPLHFSAYRPMYKLDNPPTPMERLMRAYQIAAAKLNYVYLGNVHAEVGQDTLCPHCRALLVSRYGYQTKIEKLDGEKCGACGKAVNFVNH